MADINMIVIGDGGGKKIHDRLYITSPQTVAIGTSDTVGSFTINAWCLIHTIILKLPDWSTDRTATLSIENSNSDEIYSISGLAEDSTHIITKAELEDVALVGNNTVKITLSGAPGGSGGDTETTLYLKGN